MQTLFDASRWLVYFPECMDTRKALWLVRDVLDVDALKENAFCLADGEPEALTQALPFLSAFPSVFLALSDAQLTEDVAEMLAHQAPAIPILTPRKGAFGSHRNIREVLTAGGEKAVSRLMMGAIEHAASGLLDVAEVERMDPMSLPAVLSGIRELDRTIGGFAPGELSVWTGKRGAGKSTLLGQIMVDAIQQGHCVCAYSGELSAWRFKQWISMQTAGPRHVEKCQDRWSGKEFYRVPQDVQKQIDEWWKGRFFLYDNKVSSASDEESILNVFTYAVRRYGCCVFLVDNLMTARFSASADRDFYRAQSNFAGRLVEFAKKHEVHVHLVAHPRKSEGRGIADADEVSGSGDITNRADNVFSLDRLPDTKADEYGFDTMLKILKNRSFGEKKDIQLFFDPACRRFTRPGEPEKHYGWEPEPAGFTELSGIQETMPF